MTEVVVVDIETTGFHRNLDRVLEVAAVTVDVEAGTITDLYNNTCRPDGRMGTRRNLERTWIVRNGIMDVDEVLEATPTEIVAEELRQSVGMRNQRWTAFNLAFEEKFLVSTTWRIRTSKLPCIMLAATPVCKLPHIFEYGNRGDYKWPNLEEAYSIIIGRKLEKHHRALEDARHAAEVMLNLIERGKYLCGMCARELREGGA